MSFGCERQKCKVDMCLTLRCGNRGGDLEGDQDSFSTHVTFELLGSFSSENMTSWSFEKTIFHRSHQHIGSM